MKQGLSTVKVKGRVEPVPVPGNYTLLLDYAHNGVGMENILTTLREYHPKRLICMFGAGGNRPKVRRYEMGEISGRLADISVLTADNSRFEDVSWRRWGRPSPRPRREPPRGSPPGVGSPPAVPRLLGGWAHRAGPVPQGEASPGAGDPRGGLVEAFHRESVETHGEASRKGFGGKRQIGLVPLIV